MRFCHTHRLLATVIFAYAGLSAAQWGHAAWFFDVPSDSLRCGNVVTDPFTWILNVPAPIAAASAIVLGRRCIRDRRWPALAVTALLAFVVTTACLACEGHFLARCGLECGRLWWWPWR